MPQNIDSGIKGSLKKRGRWGEGGSEEQVGEEVGGEIRGGAEQHDSAISWW